MAMNMNSNMPVVLEGDPAAADTTQYASGGNPTMAMVTGAQNDTAAEAVAAKGPVDHSDDFLMIQLSCFEGRADH